MSFFVRAALLCRLLVVVVCVGCIGGPGFSVAAPPSKRKKTPRNCRKADLKKRARVQKLIEYYAQKARRHGASYYDVVPHHNGVKVMKRCRKRSASCLRVVKRCLKRLKQKKKQLRRLRQVCLSNRQKVFLKLLGGRSNVLGRHKGMFGSSRGFGAGPAARSSGFSGVKGVGVGGIKHRGGLAVGYKKKKRHRPRAGQLGVYRGARTRKRRRGMPWVTLAQLSPRARRSRYINPRHKSMLQKALLRCYVHIFRKRARPQIYMSLGFRVGIGGKPTRFSFGLSHKRKKSLKKCMTQAIRRLSFHEFSPNTRASYSIVLYPSRG